MITGRRCRDHLARNCGAHVIDAQINRGCAIGCCRMRHDRCTTTGIHQGRHSPTMNDARFGITNKAFVIGHRDDGMTIRHLCQGHIQGLCVWDRLDKVTLILRGRRFGFALEDIRQWLMIYEQDGNEAQMRQWVALADRQMIELKEQRAQLDETLAELKSLRDVTAKTLG